MSVKSGSTGSAATVTVSNQASVPWQVHWKNPTWTQYSSSSSPPSKGRIVGLTTAEVLGSEITANAPGVWEVLDPPPQEGDHLLLTITLLDPSDGSTTDPPVAAEMLIEWMHCDTQVILLSRRLVWPETMGSATKKRKDALKFWTKVGDIFLPWLKVDNTEEAQSLPSDSGIVAATLCRQPLTMKAKTEEALEVISSMMAGLEPPLPDMGDCSHLEKNPVASLVAQTTIAKSSTGENFTDPKASSNHTTDPLCLVCLSSHGLICIYSVWDLFTTRIPSQELRSPALEEERAMATWLLGLELFDQLESTWLPLSQPKTTIALSILNEDWNFQSRDQKKGEDNEECDSSRADGVKSSITVPPKSRGASHLLAWSPWIESSTLSIRTVFNRATSIQVVGSSCPYLVVLGQGFPHDSPVVKRRGATESVHSVSNDIMSQLKDESEDSDEEKESTESSSKVSQAKSEDTDGAWWTNKHERGHALTVSQEEEKITDEGRQDAWWDNDDACQVPKRKLNKNSEMKEKESTKATTQIQGSRPKEPLSSLGGFVTLCSMTSWSESKTIFLDFVPRFVTHVGHWYGMELLLCIGEEKIAAIRLDVPSSPIFVGADEELKPVFSNDSNIATQSFRQPSHHPTVLIHRFQVLPVDLPLSSANSAETMTNQRILCAAATTPPSLLQMHTEFDLNSLQERGLLLVRSFTRVTEKGSIATSMQDHGRIAQIPVHEEEECLAGSLLHSAWGYLGQGWSLFGAQDHIYFLCWEGATAGSGISFLQELPGSPRNFCSPCCVSSILPSLSRISSSARGLDSSIRSKFSEPQEKNTTDQNTSDERDIVTDALQCISTIQQQSNIVTNDLSSAQEDSIHMSSLSHQQKSERLLRHLSSWTQLEDNDDNRELLDRHIPVIAIKTGGALNVLKMRKVVMENGGASPFAQVLGWLSQKQDYFTAASIALDLLHDPDTLYHLWKNAERIDEEGEQTKLNGLLDGIIPVKTIEDEGLITPTSTSATWTQLADMTVGCLVKGGLAMSKTLLKFLKTNQHYDPARASLMLVAAAANAVSGEIDAVTSAMGEFDGNGFSGRIFTIPELLWPVQCLLEVGVARNYLGMSLNLLNATIPEELRRLPRKGSGMTLPPLDLTKAIVTMIISSDNNGARLLLDLPNEVTSSTYWSSLSGETQQTLTMIQIRHKYPMLLHEEIREWCRELLHDLLKNGESGVATPLSNEWLRELATACLFNAGCDLQDFVLDPTNMSMISFGSENSTVWADLEMDGEDGLFQHKLEIVETRNALEPAPGSGGLDFDLLIACLLLLQSRQVSWREGEDRFVSTQALLDAACHLAGRPTVGSEAPRFALSPKTLMQLCALSGNVRAGANLIGGKNGFVLNCCDILMLELQISMEEAEIFFLSERLDTECIITTESSKFQQRHFELTESHRQLLWLLDEHVLSIRTYGEFDANHNTRGRVEPVFAARSIFRAWLCLTFFCKRNGSDWITHWLTGRLGLQRGASSCHRLACAAMVRALLWPSDALEINNNVMTSNSLLGQVLEMNQQFLIQLAQSSCGLVESVPPAIAEGLMGLTEVAHELSTSLTPAKMTRTF